MASPPILVITPKHEILNIKQREGENLKDAWYRMMESYRKCTLDVNFRILLRNFYVGLTVSHRQLLDFAAKENFIETDPSFAYEIIEGIVGVLPYKRDHPLLKKEPKS